MGPFAVSDNPSSSAACTSTSNPTRTPASRPETRAREPVVRRPSARSSTSKGTGAQRVAAPASVSTASTSSGGALTMWDVVQVLMVGRLPPDAPPVIGPQADPALLAGGFPGHPQGGPPIVGGEDVDAEDRRYGANVNR